MTSVPPGPTSKRVRTWLIAASLAVIHVVGGGAATVAQEPIPVKREILALYDGAQEGEADYTRIHRFAEMPLNHLGFIVRFQDVRNKLPEPAEIERYRGVITWFAGPVSDGNTYLAWARRVSRLNVRYVILGDVGIAIDANTIRTVNQLLALAGVRHTGEYIAPTLGTRVAEEDPNLVEFECRLGPVLPDYPILTATGASTHIGAMLEAPSYDGGRKSVLVAIGEKGAYAAWDYDMCHQRPPLYQAQWLINPFDFFRAAFGFDDQPVPDTTTASGNRLYFSVLGSEGLTRLSKIEGLPEGSAMAAEVVLHELIEPFPDLPATFELQGEELAKSERPGTQTQILVQRVLANRNVDILSRGLLATVSRFDSEYPSISNLSPLISAGSDHYVIRPMSDETAYNNQSVVGENGFSDLKETIAGTGSPRRLKPFNLNYHAYSGEYPALLRSVNDQLSAANLAELTPVSANRYAAIVDGFLSARIDRIDNATWRISGRGALQTIRFDAAEGREVDFHSSVGVIGSKRVASTLYVALDEKIEPAVVALALSASLAPRDSLALVESRWLVRDVAKDECDLRFEAQGYGDGAFIWSGAPTGRYSIAVDQAGQGIWRGEAEADDAGRLKFVLPVKAIDPVTVRINCAGAGRSALQ
jgi:hypothetical protein